MDQKDRQKTRLHPAARMYAEEYRSGGMSRREFLTRASALGVGNPPGMTALHRRLRQTRRGTPMPSGGGAIRAD